MLHFQCRQPNRMTMARALNLALLLGHPIPAEGLNLHTPGFIPTARITNISMVGYNMLMKMIFV